jgi:DNA invertase Pin-like site-specific DNA recombinase
MNGELHQKVTASHLKRDAYLYVRQSTLRQVFENTESTKRQYALRERAVALGWPLERVVVIDHDLGQSGASAADRLGFQKLVADVGMGRVGIVLGLEVSRLARSSADWHRLLEICALSDTLILDEDGIYDPSHFNDRLLLGMKGTMSEAELHVLRARLRGGILNKASRGELKSPLPVGLVYGPDERVALDPDQQVQQAVRLFFQMFRRTGSAWTTVRLFREQGLQFPRRIRRGPHKGDLIWGPLVHSTALHVLHNPRYAGAFFYGRTQSRRRIDGDYDVRVLPSEQWHALVQDAHPGYISWAEYQENLRRLGENAQMHGKERRRSPPREGPALLQGLVICGVCGNRMTVRYHVRGDQTVPDYVCQRESVRHGATKCQQITGTAIDRTVGDLLIEMVTPLALEMTLAVQQELNARLDEADRLRRQQVERARYEADLAQRRYMKVDPDNRLVADVLEAEWNQKLRALVKAQEEYEQQRQADRLVLNERQRGEVLALATDFPRLWHDPQTPHRERKRMVRLILEDVTLHKEEQIRVDVRFRGGATRTLMLALPMGHETDPAILGEIDKLLDDYTERQVAAILNRRGLVTCDGKPFDSLIVGDLRRTHGLQDRFSRLRERGLLTLAEMAVVLGVCTKTVKAWRRRGLLKAYAYNDKWECLYEPPGEDTPVKWKRKRQSNRTFVGSAG